MPPFEASMIYPSSFLGAVFELSGGNSSDLETSSHNNNNNNPRTVAQHYNNHPDPSSSAHHGPTTIVDDPRTKKMFRSVEASLTAIVDVLAHEGVSSASIQELRNGIARGDFIRVLERAKYYSFCIIDHQPLKNISQFQQPPPPSSFVVMMACLLHAAWETTCRYQSMQYKTAYRQFHRLRRMQTGRPGEVQEALALQIQRAEQVCTCQREVILIQALEQKLAMTMQQQQQQQKVTLANTRTGPLKVAGNASPATNTTTTVA